MILSPMMSIVLMMAVILGAVFAFIARFIFTRNFHY